MRRRTLLRSSIISTAVLSGCLDAGEDRSNSNNSSGPGTESTDVQSKLNNQEQNVSVESTEEISLDYVTFGIKLVNSKILEDSSALIKITLQNSSDVDRTFIFGSRPPFTPKSNDHSSKSSWYLFDSDDYVGDSQRTSGDTSNNRISNEGDCWWVWDSPVAVFAKNERRKMQPGQEISREYIMVANSNIEGCHPTGTYQWSTEYEVEDNSGEMKNFTWGFSLTVSQIDS